MGCRKVLSQEVVMRSTRRGRRFRVSHATPLLQETARAIDATSREKIVPLPIRPLLVKPFNNHLFLSISSGMNSETFNIYSKVELVDDVKRMILEYVRPPH
jgi:hypothetical protein